MTEIHATPTVRQVLAAVATAFNEPLAELLSERRHQAAVKARHAAMALSREMTPRSLPVIGRAMGRDHTTVLHGLRVHQVRLLNDPGYAARVARARTILNPETLTA